MFCRFSAPLGTNGNSNGDDEDRRRRDEERQKKEDAAAEEIRLKEEQTRKMIEMQKAKEASAGGRNSADQVAPEFASSYDQMKQKKHARDAEARAKKEAEERAAREVEKRVCRRRAHKSANERERRGERVGLNR